jgi:hypothetical protein
MVYPLDRKSINMGGVSGENYLNENGWILSTDIGCAFIALDGLTHAYKILREPELKDLIEIIIEKFLKIDKLSNKFQTHATLTATRGIFRFYEIMKDKKYLSSVYNLFDLYLKNGMTLDYENFNYFNRKNSWTEPCAIVDSFIIAINLYLTDKNDSFLTLARRIYINGLKFCFRHNGGAGTNTCVYEGNHILKISSTYEAFFCCTMRYAEGLLYINNYKKILYKNYDDESLIKDEYGRKIKGDIIYCEFNGKLIPIPETYKNIEMEKNEYKLIF